MGNDKIYIKKKKKTIAMLRSLLSLDRVSSRRTFSMTEKPSENCTLVTRRMLRMGSCGSARDTTGLWLIMDCASLPDEGYS